MASAEDSFVCQCACGARYKITRYMVSDRDQGSVECLYCDRVLLDWNGYVAFKRKIVTSKR